MFYFPNGPTLSDVRAAAQQMQVRNEDEIRKALEEFWSKGWWHRHQDWLEAIEAGTCQSPTPKMLAKAQARAEDIEAEYGFESLPRNYFDLGRIYGKLSALEWVLGGEWDKPFHPA